MPSVALVDREGSVSEDLDDLYVNTESDELDYDVLKAHETEHIYRQIKKQLKKCPKRLTYEQERYLLIQYKLHGDKEARNTLVNYHLRMVYKAVLKLKHNLKSTSTTFLDLYQAGIIGAMRAVEIFDLSKTNRLSTFMYFKILDAVSTEFEKGKASGFTGLGKGGFGDNVVGVADRLTTDKCPAYLLLDTLDLDNYHLGEKESLSGHANTPKDESESADINLVIEKRISRDQLYYAIRRLPLSLQQFLHRRFGLTDGCARTRSELAEIYGMSRSKITAIETKTLTILSLILFELGYATD